MLHILLIFFVYIKYSTQSLPHYHHNVAIYTECVNRHDHCEVWKHEGFCCYDQFKQYMENYCRLSCQLCDDQIGLCRKPRPILPPITSLCESGVSKLRRKHPRCSPRRMNKVHFDRLCVYGCLTIDEVNEKINIESIGMQEAQEEDRLEISWSGKILHIGPYKIEVNESMYQYPQLCFDKSRLRIGNDIVVARDEELICCFFSDSFYNDDDMDIDCEILI